MALHDFHCLACGERVIDFNVPVAIGARAGAPYCPSCEIPTPMEPIVAIGRMSLFSEFEKFTLPIEDPASPTGFRDVQINTLSDIRRLERDSEQAERNGEGRRMVWRDYSNDPSNKDKHTLGEDPSLTPPKHYANGTPVTFRNGAPVIADHGTIEGDAEHG